MNIKKLFATLAGVSLFAQTVIVAPSALAATYSQELQDAYNWAYGKWVTTMSSIDNANMYGAITRAEMAKMLSVYAMEVLGMTPDTSKACNFGDIDSVKGDLHDYIIKSCQLGLMGQGITSFRPYDTISRAEFGTALSRTLWGNKYEGGTPYYANHLNALKAAGIMNQIANAESTKEVRGYVMLMLMRSEGSDSSKANCEDALIKLACATDSDDCPAECREDSSKDPDEKVKSGDLTVEATANNGKAILANGVSDMDTLTFKTSEDVEITRITLERYGYSTSDDIAEVRLEDENGVTISTDTAEVDSKGQVKLSLKKDYRNIDGTLNATVVIRTSATSGSGGNKTIGFKVIDVASTAKNLNLDNYKPYTYTVVSYAGSDLILRTRAAKKTYNWEAGESYEIAKFKLKAPADTSVIVKSFTLTDAAKNAIEFDDYLEDVKVTVAGKEVKSSWTVNGKDYELAINLKDVELEAKENAEFVVTIKLADSFDRMWNAVNFAIAKAGDISATDTKTESRVLVKDLNGDAYVGNASEWYVCTFDGGKVRISSTKLGNIDASEDSTDIVIAEWEITTSQTIKSESNSLTSNNPITITVEGDKIVRAMRLVVAGDEYEGKAVDTAKSAFTFPSIEIDHNAKIKLLVDTIDGTGSIKGKSTTFKITNLDKFQYVDAKDKTKVDIAGSLNISKLTIAESESNLTNTIASEDVEFKANENSAEVEIFNGKYTAEQRDVYLKEFSLSTDAGNWPSNSHKMTVYLYLGDSNSATADAKLELVTGGWVASDSFTDVKVKKWESINVRVTAEVEAKDYNGQPDSIQFNLKLIGEDENGNPNQGNAEKKTAKVSVVEKGTAEVDAGTAQKTVLLRGSDDAIAEFVVKPSGASTLDLESVSFDKPTDVECTGLRLEGVNKNFKYSGSDTCVVDGFSKTVEKAGLTLRVVFKDIPDPQTSLIKVEINNLKVNGKEVNEKFAKAYADGVVKFSQSGDGKTETTYKVASVKWYNSNTKVRNIRFYDENGKELKTDLGADEVLTENKEFAIQNSCSGAVKIAKMSYDVVRNGYSATVVVDNATYPDYFKATGGDKLQVYANSKDHCAVNNVVKDSVPTAWTFTSQNLWWLTKSSSDLQSNVKVADGKITGTLKYIDPTWSAGNLWSATHAIALKFPTEGFESVKFQRLSADWNNGSEFTIWDGVDGTDADGTVIAKVNATTDTFKVTSTAKWESTPSVVTYTLAGLTLQAAAQ